MKPVRQGRKLLLAVLILNVFFLSGCGAPDVAQMKKSGDIAGLIKALVYGGDEDANLRADAYTALREMGTEAVDPLIDAIGDADAGIRKDAVALLGEIKDPRAVEPLTAALANDELETSALYALCKIGDVRSVDVLKKYIDDDMVAEGGLVEINVNYVQPVVSGEGVDAAAYRQDTKGPHPVVIMDEQPFAKFRAIRLKNEPENWNALMPRSWQALGEPDKIQLVLCWDKIEEKTVESTTYGNGAHGTRVQQERTVTLREAATGDVVATTVLLGEKPEQFREFIPESLESVKIDGGFSEEILIEWLKPYVEGTGA